MGSTQQCQLHLSRCCPHLAALPFAPIVWSCPAARAAGLAVPRCSFLLPLPPCPLLALAAAAILYTTRFLCYVVPWPDIHPKPPPQSSRPSMCPRCACLTTACSPLYDSAPVGPFPQLMLPAVVRSLLPCALFAFMRPVPPAAPTSLHPRTHRSQCVQINSSASPLFTLFPQQLYVPV